MRRWTSNSHTMYRTYSNRLLTIYVTEDRPNRDRHYHQRVNFSGVTSVYFNGQLHLLGCCICQISTFYFSYILLPFTYRNLNGNFSGTPSFCKETNKESLDLTTPLIEPKLTQRCLFHPWVWKKMIVENCRVYRRTSYVAEKLYGKDRFIERKSERQ